MQHWAIHYPADSYCDYFDGHWDCDDTSLGGTVILGFHFHVHLKNDNDVICWGLCPTSMFPYVWRI